jgi:hypothetical protein
MLTKNPIVVILRHEESDNMIGKCLFNKLLYFYLASVVSLAVLRHPDITFESGLVRSYRHAAFTKA